MGDLRVLCVTKASGLDKYETIQSLGGTEYGLYNWRKTRAEVVNDIESRTHTFYVERVPGHRVKLIVAKSAKGTKYVKTENDGDTPDNLLSLPTCA